MDLAGGLGQIFGGLFGDSGEPYQDAMDQYQQYLGQGQMFQSPFYWSGVGAIPEYQEWANSMKDPSDFINKIMGKYQESPWARYQQKEGIRAGNAFGSASGLTGSTPLLKQVQQNAENISSKDMGDYLQRVLGVNTQYGGAKGNLMRGGQESANAITQMLQRFGELMGEGAYGKRTEENQDRSNIFGGILKLLLG
jgi:hypothetical protein